MALCSGPQHIRFKSITSTASLFASSEQIFFNILEGFASTTKEESLSSNARFVTDHVEVPVVHLNFAGDACDYFRSDGKRSQ